MLGSSKIDEELDEGEGNHEAVIDFLLNNTYDISDPKKMMGSTKQEDMLLIADDERNTPLHYAYMFDKPTMRDKIKAHNPAMEKKLTSAWNGQGEIPSGTLHNVKLFDENKEKEAIKRHVFEMDDEDDEDEVDALIPAEHKLRLYDRPDCAIVLKAIALETLKKKLNTMAKKGGFYYQVFDRGDGSKLLVLFFDDSMLDVQAEILEMEVAMKNFHCTKKFRVYAREYFQSFNGRQYRDIVMSLLNQHLDLKTLQENNLIHHFIILHDQKKREYIKTHFWWDITKLTFGFIAHSFEQHLHIIDQIAIYFGEKHAYYLTFLIHF